jgi:putative copper export protein/methionine-rich copper-binding protein CopC
MSSKRLWVFILTLLLLGSATTASAHGYIVRAIPEDRAVLERAPARVQYWFSEALEPDFSEIHIRDQSGEIIASGGVPEDDTALLTARLPSDLPDGAYIVELRPAFASDGHVLAESRVFFVGEEVGGVAGQGPTDRALPLEVVWRGLTVTAVMILFGVFTLYAAVLIPAWGSPDHRAGWLPPRVMNRLSGIAWAALVVAVAGNLLGLIQQTMVFFNVDFTRALDPNLWSVVRIGSRFGDVWNARMILLGIAALLLGGALYFRHSQPETVRAFWTAGGWVMALVIGSYSVLSHAAGSLLWPWVAITVDWLHTLAVGLWVGGLVTLVLVLPVALQPYEGEARRLALLAALRRFSRLATAAVAVVIATGVYSAGNWISEPAELTGTTFGATLIAKSLLVMALLGLGGLHHIALRPERFARFSALMRRAAALTGTLRVEALLAVIVLLAASLLSATPLPVPDFARQQIDAPSATQTANGLTAELALLPGGPGVNTYDATVTRDGQRIDDARVRLRAVHPASDRRSAWQALERVDEGLYVTVGDEIDRAGDWWLLLEVEDDNGGAARLAFEWPISEERAVIQTIDPGSLNLLALGAVLASLGWVVYPSTRRFAARLELSAVTVTVAVAAFTVTAVALYLGFLALQEGQRRYEAQLNPPPEVINTVLPTQESLERGRALYEEHCIGWQAVSRDFNALRERLPRTRDDELFLATAQGWRGLPPCEGELSEAERWHVVNFFRTLAR